MIERRAMVLVEFAPLSVPFDRRLQTAACTLVILFGPTTIFLTFWAMVQNNYLLLKYGMILFVAWEILIDNSQCRGGRPFHWFINLRLWNLFRDYFPARLHVTERLDSSKKYVFCLHPHGIIGMSMWPTLFMGCENARERLGVDYRICTVTINFKIPMWRGGALAHSISIPIYISTPISIPVYLSTYLDV
jgi:2-acylglycerol O-acyltransferase 2